jgi:hypothetical protein
VAMVRAPMLAGLDAGSLADNVQFDQQL